MKNLVITVSPESSIDLLGAFADIIILDKDPVPNAMAFYDTLYIRSHFGQSSTLPQVFRTEIENIVKRATQENPNIKFIDGVNSVDKILSIEDKWRQYDTYSVFMPKTKLLAEDLDVSGFDTPIYKNRLSSNGNGVTWDIDKTTGPKEDWLVQESLKITEELRVYLIYGEVYPVGALRRSKSSDENTQAVDSRLLAQDEIDFSLRIGEKGPSMDIIGLDIVRTEDGRLYLLEVNRSPGFGKFEKLTGINLAGVLYGSASDI